MVYTVQLMELAIGVLSRPGIRAKRAVHETDLGRTHKGREALRDEYGQVCPYDYQVKGKYTASTCRLVTQRSSSRILVRFHPLKTAPRKSKDTLFYVLLDGLKARECNPGCSYFRDSKCKNILNARRSYVDVRGCHQFSSRWFGGSFLPT